MSPRWSTEERLEFERLCGDLPWRRLVTTYADWAQRNGYPQRTEGALRVMASEIGGSRVAMGQWIRLAVVQQITGLASPTVLRWVSRGLLPAHREGRPHRCRWYVHRDSLRKFAKQHPAYFAGLPASDLAVLFDPGSPLVEQFASMPRQRLIGEPRPVVCLDTGQTYESAVAAARDVHVTPSAVKLAIKKGRPTAGWSFRYIDQAEAA